MMINYLVLYEIIQTSDLQLWVIYTRFWKGIKIIISFDLYAFESTLKALGRPFMIQHRTEISQSKSVHLMERASKRALPKK